MASASIPVDLFNPGQVFACFGFLEVADHLLGRARAGFDWSSDNEKALFHLNAVGDRNPVYAVLKCLESSTVRSIAPHGSELSTEKWGVPTVALAMDSSFSIALPDSPATLPVQLECQFDGDSLVLHLDHWGDASGRDNVKFWAGSGGYPGAALFRDALELVRGQLAEAAADPFAVSSAQSSSFRFDWRRDYIPLDAGFSPNEHGNLVMIGFPIVELLAVIGLTDARPRRSERTKLEYRYSVLGVKDPGDLYDPILMRAALGGVEMHLPHRDFVMQLGWPGKENQARCITYVTEETRG